MKLLRKMLNILELFHLTNKQKLGIVVITKDVIAIIDVTEDGKTIEKYYAENGNMLARTWFRW